jgi:hypothetical protein
MVDQITCPHCKGTGVNYVIVTKDDKPTMEAVTCVVCKGKGSVPIPAPEPEPAPVETTSVETQEAELWPILVPLGIFTLFFFFLWL